MRLLLVIFTCLVGSLSLHASDEILKHRMIADLDIIKNTFEVMYAPNEWKKKFSSWDLEQQADIAKNKILSADHISIKDYQRIVRNFLASTRDYHVAPYFHSTEFSYLPFRIQSVDDRYFVTSVNTRSPLYKSIPLQVGDEILSFDGKPIHQAVTEFKLSEFGNPESLTDAALAEGFFTARSGIMGHIVPKGKVKISVKQKLSKDVKMFQPSWEYHDEKIVSTQIVPKLNASHESYAEDADLSEHPFFKKKMSIPFGGAIKLIKDQIDVLPHGEQDCLEQKEMLGGVVDASTQATNRIIYQPAGQFFKAYIYETPSHQRVGYIRIPTYHAGYDEAQEFSQLINAFQYNSDALIIDQVNNPGGYFFYMYAIASMLTDKPLQTPTQRQTITQEDVSFALNYIQYLQNVRTTRDAQNALGMTVQGYFVDNKLSKCFTDHFQFILNQWNEGKIFTDPDYLYGINEIQPHPTSRYTKPILMLTNSMDFSCADFLPAILQDNNRALLLGTPTAGAGGFVLKQTHPNRFGIASYTYTGSIAERANHSPIENLGVIPDIVYKMTVKDLQNNYVDYYDAIQKAIDRLVPK